MNLDCSLLLKRVNSSTGSRKETTQVIQPVVRFGPCQEGQQLTGSFLVWALASPETRLAVSMQAPPIVWYKLGTLGTA